MNVRTSSNGETSRDVAPLHPRFCIPFLAIRIYPWLSRAFGGLREKAETLNYETGPWEWKKEKKYSRKWAGKRRRCPSPMVENHLRRREKKPLHVLWRRLACDTSSVLYTHAPESSSYYVFVFTSLKAREWEFKRLWVRFFLERIDQVQFFYTVNLGGELKGQRGEKKLWISRLNEIVQRDLSAGTVLVIVRAKEKRKKRGNDYKIRQWPSSVRWRKRPFCHKKFHFQEEGNFTSEIIRQEPMRGWTGAKIDQAIQIHTTRRKR